jgi:hypothetical protein
MIKLVYCITKRPDLTSTKVAFFITNEHTIMERL